MQRIICVYFSCFILLSAASSYGPKCDGPNEKSACVTSCPPEKTCKNQNITFSCMHDKRCQLKCVCEDGFIRNDNKVCIPEFQCPLNCTGQNEFYECGPACDNVCSELHEQNRTNCPILNVMCNRKCYCLDGYARDDNNVCVPVDQCKNSIKRQKCQIEYHECTDPNEQYYDCKQTCPPDLCFTIVARLKCNASAPCKSGCFCKPGHLRKEVNTPCVPLCQCPEISNTVECT